jgi:DNA-binding LacI/PurR family transcriptional regulator
MQKRTAPSTRLSRQVSQRDVAREAGVSQATVSRVLTSEERVSEEKQERVWRAARELGYRPNAIARSLVRQSTRMVGLVVTPFFNPYYSRVIAGFTSELQERGFWTMLLNVDDQNSVEETLPEALRYQLDGVILASATLSSRLADECAQSGTPVVLFNRYVLDAEVHSVCCDNVAGGAMVAKALIDGGHERYAYVSGVQETSTDRDRMRGFAEELASRGYRLAYHEVGSDTYESGAEVARRLLQRDEPPDAVFCATDLMALGVLDVARCELGLNVPRDVSIVGFDDIPMAAWRGCSLTTVRQPVDEMVPAAVEIMLKAVEKPGREVVARRILPTLVRRGSARL